MSEAAEVADGVGKRKRLKILDNLESFLLNAPLYEDYELPKDLKPLLQIYRRTDEGRTPNFDAYCPYCKQDTPFKLNPLVFTGKWEDITDRLTFLPVTISCTRRGHIITFWLRQFRIHLMKAGQDPSLADIANDETRTKYRAVLKGKNSAELYKAIGLAAHGEGIGSFVYLRRIFERLVNSRFQEFKDVEGWSEPEFERLRMDEKIDVLKDHLPPSLVEMRRIYSIFSKGLHELENDLCLKFFDVGKRSIITILEDDLKKKEELDVRAELKKAISAFEDG